MSLIQTLNLEMSLTHVFIGESAQAAEVRKFVSRVAETEYTVFLRGETGTGKDLVARMIHSKGHPGKAFIPIGCKDMPESLMESEFFGHAKGAFTGAIGEKQGLIQTARGGILYIDEVEDASPDIQAKLLRVIEKKNFRRLGATQETIFDARIIVAINTDPEDAVRNGKLRSDLYHRLNTIPLTVPPLRERKEDIPALVKHFSRETRKAFSAKAMKAMMDYDWPGNVRELENAVIRALFLADGPGTIGQQYVEPYLTGADKKPDAPSSPAANQHADPNGAWPSLLDIERNHLISTLDKTGGNVTKAARLLGISRNALYNRLWGHEILEKTKSMKES